MTATYDLYLRVWGEIRKLVAIHYDETCCAPANGYYQDNSKLGPPIIMLCTKGGFERTIPHKPSRILTNGEEATDARLLHEMVTLAHEYGHVVSQRDRTPPEEWRRYRAAEDRRLREDPISTTDRDIIVAEERLAWRIGRELLTSLGFNDWLTYTEREERSVATYEKAPISESSLANLADA